MAPPGVNPYGLAPEEAIRWFRSKGYAITFDWYEMMREEHARAFTVAKATQLDVLGALRTAVDQALSRGDSLATFRKNLTPTLAEKGWWGRKTVVDPDTGEEREVQLGSPQRLRTIYDTNLNTAQAAAHWERIQRTAQARPWLRYVALEDGRTRKEHLRWHNTILPHDHPWWDTHFPPNGWGCRCKVMQLSDRDLARYGLQPSKQAPPSTPVTWTVGGRRVSVPSGIDPSFDYNPGRGRGSEPITDLAPAFTRGARRAADYGRPPARDAERRPALDLLPSVPRGPGRRARIADQIRQTLGTTQERPVAVLTDPTGVQVSVNEYHLSQHLARKPGSRERWLPLVRETIERPFEIWLVPVRRPNGEVVLRQRYLGVYNTADGRDLLVVAEGNSAFDVYPHERIDSERVGYLVYPRDGA